MKIIKELSEMISEEIDDAEKYIRHAIECKDTDRQLANTFAELSNQECYTIDAEAETSAVTAQAMMCSRRPAQAAGRWI